MTAISAFKLILLALAVMIALQIAAKRLLVPPAVALLIGGVALAMLPGLPSIELEPDLVLVVFLPPLLMYGAYFSVVADVRRHLGGILMLAVGAVAFTTFAVGVVTHAVVPALPWGACFALGAIVSPPDAVAAKAVLERVALPRKLMVLLEGESLLNDAAGLVLVRFAVVAALTGSFNAATAMAGFAWLAVGGVVVGAVVGYAVIFILRYLRDDYLVITLTLLAAWGSYLAGEAAHVSGVISAVTCGLIVGWYQHDVLNAATRMRATAFWQVLIFIFEALVFILIGLALPGVLQRLWQANGASVWTSFGPAIGAIIFTVVISRFVWVFGTEGLYAAWRRGRGAAVSASTWRAAAVISWAGMRGVVTLAVALALPAEMPGRDLILLAAFAVIFASLLLQGTTMGPVIRWMRLSEETEAGPSHMTEPQAWSRLEAAQLAAIAPLVQAADGTVLHPRLLEQYRYRATLAKSHENDLAYPEDLVAAHFDIVLTGNAAARGELLRLRRAGAIGDDLLHSLENHLDLQEVSARVQRGAE